ncbi:very-long-chain 3-oxoacyl-CoA reductase-B-like [Babylonia areolata]|uniref:very-long-chain 3-oxoacyl-CoA reductase-B-like n=1 Tax=Babylonia areolata TaxID=304850 RepID=UPI003FCFE5DD
MVQQASLETNMQLENEGGMGDFAASTLEPERRVEPCVLGQWNSVAVVVGTVFVAYYFVFQVIPLAYNLLMYGVCVCCGPVVKVGHFGEWAVVTGCTDGIGKAYAEQLAAMGLNIVLVSRSQEKLQHQAQQISDRTGVLTRTIVADFSQQDIYARIAIQLDGLDIGVLVNNVGMGMDPEFFLNMPDNMEMMSAMINCNVFSVTMMTAVVLPSMVAKKKGVIINVASASGCRPVPLMALYSSTKAMVIHLTEALHQEYGERGILFQAVTPFLVSTKMSNMADPTGIVVPTPEVYVRHALRVLGVATVTPAYFWHHLQYWCMCLLPGIVLKRGVMTFKDAAERKGKATILQQQQQQQKYHVNV